MGTYLSTPVTEKHHEQADQGTRLSWAVVDMQGWRKSMEDAHVAEHVGWNDDPTKDRGKNDTAKNDPEDAPSQFVFGVFDGHGGPEVARFCQVYFTNTLLQQQQKNAESTDASSSTGTALIETFHALDRMIDDPGRRDELIRLRAIQPGPGETRPITEAIPSPLSLPATTSEKSSTPASSQRRLEVLKSITSSPEDPLTRSPLDEAEARQQEEDEALAATFGTMDIASTKPASESPTAVEEQSPNKVEEDDDDDDNLDEESGNSDDSVGNDTDEVEKDRDDFDISPNPSHDANDESPDSLSSSTSENFRAMFQRLLMQVSSSPTPATSGHVVVDVEESMSIQQTSDSDLTRSTALTTTTQETSVSTVSTPSASIVSTTTTVRKTVCTLPDHPIHAGATAIVAVLSQPDNMLTVANAGDSRAVLCRRLRPPVTDDSNDSGSRILVDLTSLTAIPLSHDHKPQLDTERNRIERAGGFVNQFGRVNGNLNLSRSIGDLKYKQDTSIPPADQIISAEPDIVQIQIEPEDEFILLGCDGIWDCLDNEQAVNYVASRIDSMPLVDIGCHMLDDIISVDPRATQGIGGDNMTIMIVDLQPHARSHRKLTKAQESID